MNSNIQNKNKYVYIQALRIIAIFFVIFNHTGDSGSTLFSKYPSNSIVYWIYAFLSVFCKISVPLFFAISGALLIPKEETLKDLFSKRILKIAIVLILISALYYLININFVLSLNYLSIFISSIYETRAYFHLWYLYTYLAFLVSLPLIRKFARNLDNTSFIYMTIIYLLFNAIIPTLELLLFDGNTTYCRFFDVSWILSQIVYFPILGYFINSRIAINNIKKYIPYILLANIIAILISCYSVYYESQIIGNYTENYRSSFVAINVASTFLIIKYYFEKKNINRSGIINSLGDCAFGTYLIHPLIIQFIDNRIDIIAFLTKTLHINDMVACMLFCLLILFVCYLIVLLLKKIPLINKLI